MSRIDSLILELCPEGTTYKRLWEITAWDRRFNEVLTNKQAKIIKYFNSQAAELKSLASDDLREVRILTTNPRDFLWTTKSRLDGKFSNGEIISIPGGGNASIQYYKGDFVSANNIIATSIDPTKFDTKFLYFILLNRRNELQNYYRGSGIQHPSMQRVLEMLIPAPPIEVQKEIVSILDKFTELEAELEAELEVRNLQYQYFLKFFTSEKYLDKFGFERIRLGDFGKVMMCKRIFKHETKEIGDVPFFKIGTFGGTADAFIDQALFEKYKNKYPYPQKGDILLSASGTIGKQIVFDGKPSYFQDSNIIWLQHDSSKVLNSWLHHIFQNLVWPVQGGTINRLYGSSFEKIEIPVPPVEVQARLAERLDAFEHLTFNSDWSISAEITFRRKQFEYYLEKLMTFKEIETE